MSGRVVLKVRSLTKNYYTRVFFTPLEKAADFNRRSLPFEADGGLKPPSAQTVRERSSLTGFTLKKVAAVDILDLEIVEGEIFGFLGPNGAGKTTTLNMVVGITEPSSGEIEIFGRPFKSSGIEALSRIGYVPEATLLPGYLTVVEFLDFCARLFDLPKKVRYERILLLLEMVGLLKEKNTLLENLSMGQRRLIDIIQALINDPDLILLDEPTVYLDPLIMEHLRRILCHLKENGKTVIFSSHVISEIEKIADRVAIIDHGRLLKVGPKKDFIRQGSMEEEFLRIVKHANS